MRASEKVEVDVRSEPLARHLSMNAKAKGTRPAQTAAKLPIDEMAYRNQATGGDGIELIVSSLVYDHTDRLLARMYLLTTPDDGVHMQVFCTGRDPVFPRDFVTFRYWDKCTAAKAFASLQTALSKPDGQPPGRFTVEFSRTALARFWHTVCDATCTHAVRPGGSR
jgi:hypothetical protein